MKEKAKQIDISYRNPHENSYVYEFDTTKGLYHVRAVCRGKAADYMRNRGHVLRSDVSHH